MDTKEYYEFGSSTRKINMELETSGHKKKAIYSVQWIFMNSIHCCLFYFLTQSLTGYSRLALIELTLSSKLCLPGARMDFV